MITICFHGQVPWFINGAHLLERDIGDNFTPISIYYRGFDQELLIQTLEEIKYGVADDLLLIGYSKGGDFIANLTHTRLLPRIKGAVLYEAPLFDNRIPKGDFPVFIAWNDRGRRRTKRGEREGHDTYWKWAENHSCTVEWGVGKHLTLFPPSHCWDKNLNPLIKHWIDNKVISR